VVKQRQFIVQNKSPLGDQIKESTLLSYAQDLFTKIGASQNVFGSFKEQYTQECNEVRALSQYLDSLV
jgi:hypothetical protein